MGSECVYLYRAMGKAPQNLTRGIGWRMYLSIEKFINEYRMRKAVKEYAEGRLSLGKATEVAGISKRKFMAMIEDFGIPINIDAHDLMKGFGFLSELRRYSSGEKAAEF